MSRTEFHTGRLIPVHIDTTLEEKCIDIAFEHNVTLATQVDDWQEEFMDEFGEWGAKRHNRPEYFIHKGSLYLIRDHVELEDNDYFMHLTKHDDGSISFIGQFYNGGTCFSEMLNESLDEYIKE